MEGSDVADALERYLESAPLVSSGEALSLGNTEPTGGHPEKHRIMLAGGVYLLAKPGHDQFEATARREAAGWQIAKSLGFVGLVAGTVLRRDVPRLSTHAPELHSVQIMWPDGRDWCPGVERFPREEVWQAAVFDGIVAHADHTDNNWFGIPAEASGAEQHLRLVDTGNAFDLGGDAVNSTFYTHHHGDTISDEAYAGVQMLYENWPSTLVHLLGEDEVQRTRARTQRLVDRRVLRVEP